MDLLKAHFFDQFSLPVLFVLTVLVQALFIEFGFRLGTRHRRALVKPQVSQVRAIMGAGLGLTAFMLAFTFATAQSHYEARVQAMVEEARLLRTAFLQAEFLSDEARAEARTVLREYAGDRLAIREALDQQRLEEAVRLAAKSAPLQARLWKTAVRERERAADSALPSRGKDSADFEASAIGLIDVHVQRLEASLMNRIPDVLWVTLYLTAALAMLVMGYQAGLVTRRSPYATVTLAVAFAAVLMLIMDLDRPVMTLFEIDNHAMVDVVDRMDEILRDSAARR